MCSATESGREMPPKPTGQESRLHNGVGDSLQLLGTRWPMQCVDLSPAVLPRRQQAQQAEWSSSAVSCSAPGAAHVMLLPGLGSRGATSAIQQCRVQAPALGS